jgi:tetratricopeptide (TPR) repeat protein
MVMRRLSDRTLNWAIAVAAILVVVGIAVLAGIYIWDNNRSTSPSILERETQFAEEALAESPDDFVSFLRLGSLYLERGWVDEAITLFEQALILEEDEPSTLVSLGAAYQSKGDEGMATAYYEQVVGILGESEYAPFDQRLYSAYFNLGQIHTKNERWEEATMVLESAAALQPTNADVLHALAVAYQGQDRHEDAIKVFQRAYHLVPDFKEVYENIQPSYEAMDDEAGVAFARGMTLLLDGKTGQARGELEKAVAIREDGDIYWGLGWASEEQGHRDQALEEYQQAMRLDPTHFAAAAGIGRLQGLEQGTEDDG